MSGLYQQWGDKCDFRPLCVWLAEPRGVLLRGFKMCGIVGYFAQDGLRAEEGEVLVRAMMGALKHRGPDDQGLKIHPHCGLGSTRLSIVDLQGGHMPMHDPEQGLTVAYNGEIYDHAEHRTQLAAQGHVFSNHCDTEVLLPLYRAHGTQTGAQIAGMFAFALWDEPRRRLLLTRDRFGVKPLFVATSDDGKLLLFASEIKALLASGRVAPRLDPRALQDVFSAGYPMPPRTMFLGIEALVPGSWRELSVKAGTQSGRYYDVPYPDSADPGLAVSRDRAATDFRAILDETVKGHLMADVPVASYLSGGIDSVSVATLASGHTQGLSTFSMVFGGPDRRYDESMHSDLAAGALDVDHHRVLLDSISQADFEGTIQAMEAPQIHTVGFCLYQLARAVKEAGLKVVLSGEGADEVLAGYRAFRIARFRRALSGNAAIVRRGLVRAFVARRKPEFAKNLLDWWALEPEVEARYGLIPPWVEQWWLMHHHASPMLHADLQSGPGITALPDAPSVNLGFESALHRDLRFEQASRLDGWVLAMGDRLSMAHSVELRVPFVDHRLVDSLARLPPNYLLRRTQEKQVLRNAMKADLPPVLARRSKRAFIAPSTEWLFGAQIPDWIRDTLSESSLKQQGWFDWAEVQSALARVQDARGLDQMALSWGLTAVLSSVVWAQQFRVS